MNATHKLQFHPRNGPRRVCSHYLTVPSVSGCEAKKTFQFHEGENVVNYLVGNVVEQILKK